MTRCQGIKVVNCRHADMDRRGDTGCCGSNNCWDIALHAYSRLIDSKIKFEVFVVPLYFNHG